MAGHTPGPWLNRYPKVFQVEAPLTQTRIASLPHSVSDEQEANARLIGAAPDLLAAAKALIRVLDQNAYLNNEIANIEFWERVSILEAMIEKAEGQAKPEQEERN